MGPIQIHLHPRIDLRQLRELVIQLHQRLGTERLVRWRPDVDVIHQGLVLQFGHLRGFWKGDLHQEVGFTHHGGHHEEEQEHEDDVRQRSRADRWCTFSGLVLEA
jgi:hypothetical protein